MTRDAFLQSLRQGLAGLPDAERDDILADYAAYFDEARASGRDDADVAAALGDPKRLARELRAESGLRGWEARRSLGSFATAFLALGGLATVDILLLPPLLIVLGALIFAVGVVFVVLGVTGAGLVLTSIPFGLGDPIETVLSRTLTGIGLLAATIGVGALLLLSVNAGMALLARLARLHYRFLKPVGDAASDKLEGMT